jgi:hypothetical protein
MMRRAMVRARREGRAGKCREKQEKNGVFHEKRMLTPPDGIAPAFSSPFSSDLHKRNRREAK